MSEYRSESEREAAGLMRDLFGFKSTKDIAAALSAANLLRTDADRLYAELAEAMVAYTSKLTLQDESTDCQSRIALNTAGPLRTRVWAALRAILDARKPKPAPLDEVLSLWRECKCKVPGPLSDALDRLERERAK